MAYDAELAGRIRQVLAELTPEDVVEQPAFGGLAFLVGGHMAVAAGSRGDLMVRCDPADAPTHHVAGAAPMEMRGRTMTGWLLLGPDQLVEDAVLARWVQVGLDRVRTLPPKG